MCTQDISEFEIQELFENFTNFFRDIDAGEISEIFMHKN